MSLLEDILVVDFSQFLSGPSAGLRLADMGARVIKIEKPGTGDICRELYVSDVMIGGESTIFHAINRNKESFAADLKDPSDLEQVIALIRQADVVMHNFRPGVMERIGLDYATVKEINPSIIYAEINGYGSEGPWKDLPGQDLLLQAVSGLTWLSNNDHTTPTPMGVAVVDILAGTHIAQGILATLYRRTISGEGALVQVSMFESILDFQFEVLTCFYNDGHELPVRSSVNNGHAYIAAPYGLYKTLEMGYSIDNLTFSNLCLGHFLTLFIYNDKHYETTDEKKDMIDEAILYMQQHVHDNISLQDLCAFTHYSPSRFSSLFKQKTGYAPIDYFLQLKMQKASQLLDFTDKSVKDIGAVFGFDDPYYFSRRFTKIFGMSPKKYRSIKKD